MIVGEASRPSESSMASQIVRNRDIDGDGRLSALEFSGLERAFLNIDRNKDGELNRPELRRAIKKAVELERELERQGDDTSSGAGSTDGPGGSLGTGRRAVNKRFFLFHGVFGDSDLARLGHRRDIGATEKDGFSPPEKSGKSLDKPGDRFSFHV